MGQERNWEQSIEDALLDAGMEVDRGKKEPPHLIRKMKERIMKKKEKIVNLKSRYSVFYVFMYCNLATRFTLYELGVN